MTSAATKRATTPCPIKEPFSPQGGNKTKNKVFLLNETKRNFIVITEFITTSRPKAASMEGETMPTQLGVRHDAAVGNHARGHGPHDGRARTTEAQPISSRERGPQTSMSDADNADAHDAVRRLEELVDETLKASFPASDPPGWTLGGSRRDPHRPGASMT